MPEYCRQCLRIIVAFCLLLACPVAAFSAQPRIILDRSHASVPLSDNMEILEDPQQLLSIQDIASGREQQAFKRFTRDSPNFGNTQSAFWFRTLLVNPYPQTLHLVIEEPLPFLDSIDLYLPDPQNPGEFLRRHTGDRRPFAEREIQHHRFLFNLELKPGEILPLHFRVASRVTLMAPFNIWFKHAWDRHAQTLSMNYGIFFGILAMLFLMALFLSLQMRDRIYLLFALFVFSIALMSATTHGLAYEYLWPESPFLAERMQVVSITFVMVTGILYARTFLETRRNLPRLDLLLRYFQLLLVLIMAGALLVPEVKTLAVFSFVLIQVYSPLLLATGIMAKRRKVPAARFYLLAWTSSLIGSVIAGLTMLGIIPYRFVLLHATSTGFLLDTVLLSLAMADRLHALRMERDLANKRAHDTLVEARNNLESEVERRTGELIAAKREADSANQAKTRFLANMSHELRTPLTTIIGFTELLISQTGTQLRETQRRNLKTIHESGMHLNALIEDVLDVSMIETGKIKVKMEPVSFRTVLDEVLAITSNMALRKGICVTDTSAEDHPHVVVADRLRLRQVATNLMTNAIKYSPDDSEVLICLRRQDGKVRFSVIDRGPGIPPADLENIFKPFTRLEQMADKVEGIGIGLSIARTLIGLMAGEIHVESRVGRGTSFHIDLVETMRAPRDSENTLSWSDSDNLEDDPLENIYLNPARTANPHLETVFQPPPPGIAHPDASDR